MDDRTPNPYNAVHSFDTWLGTQLEYPLATWVARAVGTEIEVPCYAVVHHELTDEAIDSQDIIDIVDNKKLFGRVVSAEARIVAYVGIDSAAYAEPQADDMLKMRNTLFALFRFRPRIEIRNYQTDTNFADLDESDKGYITCESISEESAISDVKDSYILLEQAFRVRYQYVHQVIES